MATWNVTGTVSLGTSVVPDGTLECDGAPHFSDESYFYGEDVSVEGTYTFQVDAPNEDEARERADALAQNMYFSSNDGVIEWEVGSIYISSVERETPPPTPEEAIEIIRAWVETVDGDDLHEAFDVLVTAFNTAALKVALQEGELEVLRSAHAASTQTIDVLEAELAEAVRRNDVLTEALGTRPVMPTPVVESPFEEGEAAESHDN